METIADIVAEMREHNKETTPPYVCFTEEGGIDLSQIIDRIEAVTKCNQPEPVTICNGLNAAKMREALEKCRKAMDEMSKSIFQGWIDDDLVDVMGEAQRAISSALSAPPRNCDIYDAESCRMAYHLHDDGLMTMQAYADWLFAEAKGETK